MLDRLPSLAEGLKIKGRRAGVTHYEDLRAICGEWNVAIRYSTRTGTHVEARQFLDRVRRLKEVLR